MINKSINAKGLACPLPVINTKQVTDEMTEGGTVQVIVDNEIAVQNLQKFSAQKGYKASSTKKSDDEFEVIIEVPAKFAAETKAAEEVNQNAQESEIVCQPDDRQKGMVVVLSSNTMGQGEEKLGKSLMKAFVFALTKQDALPETILCYNSGAFLTTEGADTLEDLRELEAEGVTIMTCGTCMDFYGIKDKLAVGSVTNMYEIVNVMENAKKIIKP